jgi:Domain of unknown function (DUF4397)
MPFASQRFAIALVGVITFAQGCDDTTGVKGDAASVRVAHAAPDAAPLDVLLNGQASTGRANLAFGETTDCFRVNPDDPRLTFRASTSGALIPGPESFGFGPRGRHILAVWGTPSNLRFTSLTDLADPPVLEPGRARVRLFNGTSVPGRVYVYATVSGVPQMQQAFVDSLLPSGYTPYVNVPAGAVELQVNQGAGGNVLDRLNLAVVAGQEVTVMAVDPPAGAAGLRWVLAATCPAG